VGIAWDARANHTLAVRGHVGRYHEEMVTSFYDFLDPLAHPTFIDAAVIGPNQFAEIYRGDASNSRRIDPDISYPYADEWLAGVDQALAGRVTLTAQYVGRRYGSIIGFVGPMDVWTPTQVRDPGPDGVPDTADDGDMMTIYLNPGTTPSTLTMTNPSGAYKHYQGLQLIATRRASGRWQGLASYTYSRTRASFDNAFSSNAANNDLSVNGVYVNPNRALFSTGRVAADYTHEFKMFGMVAVPYVRGLTISGVYRYQNGYAWARVVRFPVATQLFAEAVEPRGAHEGPATNVGDLRIEQSFRIGSMKLSAYVDAFNVGNQGIARRYQILSGPNFGLPGGWSDPRTMRFGARFSF
jgi:hypothetical protein